MCVLGVRLLEYVDMDVYVVSWTVHEECVGPRTQLWEPMVYSSGFQQVVRGSPVVPEGIPGGPQLNDGKLVTLMDP